MNTQIPEQLEPLITQATDAALLWARLDAGLGLVGGLIFLGLSIFLGRVALRWWRENPRVLDNTQGPDESDEGAAFITIVIATLIFAFVALFHLFNPWRWIGVFEPSVWLIQQAVSSL